MAPFQKALAITSYLLNFAPYFTSYNIARCEVEKSILRREEKGGIVLKNA
jgi:hypothetical protein